MQADGTMDQHAAAGRDYPPAAWVARSLGLLAFHICLFFKFVCICTIQEARGKRGNRGKRGKGQEIIVRHLAARGFAALKIRPRALFHPAATLNKQRKAKQSNNKLSSTATIK